MSRNRRARQRQLRWVRGLRPVSVAEWLRAGSALALACLALAAAAGLVWVLVRMTLGG